MATAAAVTMLVAPGPIEDSDDHDLAAPHRLGEADRGERHRLLVLAAPGRQLVLDRLQRLAEAGDVAMAEDGENAGEERHLAPVDDGLLGSQVADQGLRHGQPDGLHVMTPPWRLSGTSGVREPGGTPTEAHLRRL